MVSSAAAAATGSVSEPLTLEEGPGAPLVFLFLDPDEEEAFLEGSLTLIYAVESVSNW